MIQKIIAFNKMGQSLFKRAYRSSVTDNEIKVAVKCSKFNITDVSGVTIIFKKYQEFYIAFVVENENEMYILQLITFLEQRIENAIDKISEAAIDYHFRECLTIVDNFVVDGKVITLEIEKILSLPVY